jgi:hypothetical protein
VLTVKELMSSSVTVNFSRKALLSEVRNEEGKPSDRSFVSKHRLKMRGERRNLYVCLWGRDGGVGVSKLSVCPYNFALSVDWYKHKDKLLYYLLVFRYFRIKIILGL